VTGEGSQDRLTLHFLFIVHMKSEIESNV